jgi:cation diffusion facilitator family transporter
LIATLVGEMMLRRVLDWFGLGGGSNVARQPQAHDHGSARGHTHGVIDPSITTTARGIWAVKWSFVILAVTAVLQMAAVVISGSVALLADTIHNIGDATTAVPLWIAFALARRKPTATFTYGYGRVEDVAGALIVLIILFSGLVAGYEAIDRLIHPLVIEQIGWVVAAGIVGFAGNEAVAVFRIRVGREINSAALIADGYHARTDGLTSLAVVVGAIGVRLGFPLADPLIGLTITIAIFGIVWQSARVVFTRMLDGVEPGIVDEIRHAADHVAEIKRIVDVKARWLGHRLDADVTIAIDRNILFAAADHIAETLKDELFAHLPALGSANVHLVSAPEHPDQCPDPGHHRAPAPFRVVSRLADGLLEIADSPNGAKMILRVARHAEGLRARVAIQRPGGVEELVLEPTGGNHHRLESRKAPAEPHEFTGKLLFAAGELHEELPFKMNEPATHDR